jgi:hypothetical protein
VVAAGRVSVVIAMMDDDLWRLSMELDVVRWQLDSKQWWENAKIVKVD